MRPTSQQTTAPRSGRVVCIGRSSTALATDRPGHRPMTPRTLDEDTGKGSTFPKGDWRHRVGVRGHLVAVEAHVGRELPSLTLTGLRGPVVQDARDRIRPASFASPAAVVGWRDRETPRGSSPR